MVSSVVFKMKPRVCLFSLQILLHMQTHGNDGRIRKIIVAVHPADRGGFSHTVPPGAGKRLYPWWMSWFGSHLWTPQARWMVRSRWYSFVLVLKRDLQTGALTNNDTWFKSPVSRLSGCSPAAVSVCSSLSSLRTMDPFTCDVWVQLDGVKHLAQY